MKAIRVRSFGEPEVLKLEYVPARGPRRRNVQHLDRWWDGSFRLRKPAAHQLVMEGEHFGKIVLIP